VSGGPWRRGRVVDPSGRPVRGARVVVVRSSVPVPEIALVTDADGGFGLALPDGQFTLRAHGAGGATGEVDFVGGRADEMLIRLDR
jgi:Carboxypeptidase regulatory-like domain